MSLYDTAQTHQTGSLKLEGRFYRAFGKTYILLSYFHKLSSLLRNFCVVLVSNKSQWNTSCHRKMF